MLDDVEEEDAHERREGSTATGVDEGAAGSSGTTDIELGKCRAICCGENIAYIGVGVIFREREAGGGDDDSNLEVLLAQEAKRRCYGKWYIPAGRIVPGETILEGVVREVLEETGYKCEPEELLSVQVQGSGWYRFSFYCNIVGGERKVTADIESLCAEWFPLGDVKAKKMELRASDFLKIVEEGLRYWRRRKELGNKLSQFLPVPVSVPGLFIEFAILRTVNEKTEILVHKNVSDEKTLAAAENVFPLVEFGFQYFFPMVVLRCFQHILINGRNALEMPSQLTQVQCLPAPVNGTEHGIRVRVLCNLKLTHVTSSDIRDPHRYHWITVNASVLEQLYMAPGQYRPVLNML